MNHVYPLSFLIEPGILSVYMLIAVQAWVQSRLRRNAIARRALVSLAVIFVLCGVTRTLHYLPLSGKIYHDISALCHLAVLAAAINFALNRQIADLSNLFKEDDDSAA